MRRINARIGFLIFLFVMIVAKILVFHLCAIQPFGTRGDADQYHAYALGLDEVAYTAWPPALRFLHSVGLYSREGIAWVLLGLNILAIPALAAFAAVRRDMMPESRRSAAWAVAVLVSLYPALYFYALDIYRDEFMMFVFVLGLSCTRRMLDEDLRGWARWSWALPWMACAGMLYMLRPYLGAAFLVALPGALLFDFSRARLWRWSLAYLAGLNLVFALGWLDRVAVHYRAIFATFDGDTTVGIVFDSPWTFLVQFIRSWLYQMLGLYFPTGVSWLPFFLESVPFIAASCWLLRNRRYADRYVGFLVVFFFAYATVWVLGNDNLGAAVRLRMFNYVTVLVACGVVWGNRTQMGFLKSCNDSAEPAPLGRLLQMTQSGFLSSKSGVGADGYRNQSSRQ